MGKMDEKEMIAISIIAIIFSPFIIAGRIIKNIGQTLGIIEPEKNEYDPKMDPNYKESTPESASDSQFYKPGDVGYTENKIDQNS